MKRLMLLIVPWFLVACGSASPASLAGQTSTLPEVPTAPPGLQETKMYQLTAEMMTRTAVAPRNDATITAIMASKYAGGTAAAETMTAMPTPSLTPTIPPDSPDCRALDMKAFYEGAMGAAGSLVIGVSLTNNGRLPCFLQIRPQAVFVDRNGRPLDLQYSYSPNWDTPADPQAMLGLPLGKSAGFNMQFGNLCQPQAATGVLSVRLTLAGNGGIITIPTDQTIQPGSSARECGNWVGVSPISMP